MVRAGHFLAAVLVVMGMARGLAGAAEPGFVSLPDSIRPVTASSSGTVSPDQPFISRHTLTPAETDAPLGFQVALKMRNFVELQARMAKGESISTAEMAEKYEPSAADYETVSDWLTSAGLLVTHRDSHHTTFFVRGKIEAIAKAFHVRFARVTFDGSAYTAAITAPSAPANIAPLLTGINGLQPYMQRH
jgi:kumamolisin